MDEKAAAVAIVMTAAGLLHEHEIDDSQPSISESKTALTHALAPMADESYRMYCSLTMTQFNLDALRREVGKYITGLAAICACARAAASDEVGETARILVESINEAIDDFQAKVQAAGDEKEAQEKAAQAAKQKERDAQEREKGFSA